MKPSLQDAEHDRADQAAEDGARSAGQRGAADHAGGDGEEHVLGAAGERIGRGDAEGFEDAGEAAEQAGQHEVADLDAPDMDAGLARADGIAADGDGVQAPAGMAQHDVHHRDDGERPDDLGIGARRP